MATWLFRIGQASMRRAWLVIVAWALVVGGVLGGALALGPAFSDTFEIPGTQSQAALDRLTAVFPQVAGAAAQVVVDAPGDASIEDSREAITAMAREIEQLDGVEAVIDPWNEYATGQVSDDGRMAYLQVQYDVPAAAVTDAQVAELVATADAPRAAGLTVEFASQIFQATSVGITIVEVFGLIFAAVVLFVTFWSFLAAGLPLITALVGVGITMGGILAASALSTVSSSAPLMALMIGLAVGIDYALFILTKHRSQLAKGMGVLESGATAVGTAGTAVLFAGLTVVIALLGLLIVGIPFLSVMGVGAAVAVAIAVTAAVTLLPAIMGLLGERLRPKPGSRAHRLGARDLEANPTMGMRWVRGVTRRPVVWIVGVLAVLGVVSVPAFSLELALPDNGAEAPSSTARKAYDLLQEGFGPGAPGPLVVMVDITQTTDVLGVLDNIATDLEGVEGVASVGSRFPDQGADTGIVQVVSESSPTSHATTELVQRIRDLGPEIAERYDTPISVTGTTAVQIDISTRLADALVPFGVVVVTLALVLLLLVFRSIVVPVTAALGFLLSYAAAIGTTVAVLQWGWGADLVHAQAGPLLSFMPVLLMAVLFGLAMDYQVFLVSGMREAFVHGHVPVSAVRHGFAANARVVTAAALIMFFVFFAFVPEGMAMMKAIALGLAVGVAVDAFLVRMTLIPAVLALVGRGAWWIPAWLDRVLPRMDVEGESLAEHKHASEWASRVGGHVAFDELIAGHGDVQSAPMTLVAPRGAVVRVMGDALDRRVLAHTLVGTIPPVSGRVHVHGNTLPSDAAEVQRLVAYADLGQRVEASVRELIGERLALRAPWQRLGRTRRDEDAAIRQVQAALASVGAPSRIDADQRVQSLAPVARAAVLMAAALAGEPEVLIVDSPHGLPEHAATLAAHLADQDVTVLVSDADATPQGRDVLDVRVTGSAGAHARAASDTTPTDGDPVAWSLTAPRSNA